MSEATKTTKANELRIGNYYNHDGETREVTVGTIKEVWNAERNWVEPILLTEEWLLNFGLTMEIGGNFGMNAKKYVSKAFTVLGGITEDKNIFLIWKNGKVLTHLKYVHQLQNLYFCLTGVELTVANCLVTDIAPRQKKSWFERWSKYVSGLGFS